MRSSIPTSSMLLALAASSHYAIASPILMKRTDQRATTSAPPSNDNALYPFLGALGGGFVGSVAGTAAVIKISQAGARGQGSQSSPGPAGNGPPVGPVSNSNRQETAPSSKSNQEPPAAAAACLPGRAPPFGGARNWLSALWPDKTLEVADTDGYCINNCMHDLVSRRPGRTFCC